MKQPVPPSPEAGSLAGIGATLKAARLAQGLSLYALAHELKISVEILEAVEEENWSLIPAGRERPHTRQIAEHLGVALEALSEQWRQLPGALEQEPRDPRQESLERILMSALTVGCVGLLLWLVVPGRSLRHGREQPVQAEVRAAPAPWVPKDPAGLYPVLGEVLPEAPLNAEGVLITLRAMDTCEASIQGPDAQVPPQRRSLRVSEPWHLRVKGPFTVTLDNAGVVALEVAGRRIRHGRNVGEAWTGQFGPSGDWAVPEQVESTVPTNVPDPDGVEQEVE